MDTKHTTAETSAEPQHAKPTRPALPERFARAVSGFAGTTAAACLAMLTIVLWASLGPFFQYNDRWQLVINTGTTIVTFLMVFLIQRSQNKDALAIHLKLNEIVAALGGASNRLVTAEDLSERDLADLHRHYQQLAQKVRASDPRGAHSVEEEEHARRRTRTAGPLGARPHRMPPRRRRRTKSSA
jgi:low affinity Fe/Cu permease